MSASNWLHIFLKKINDFKVSSSFKFLQREVIMLGGGKLMITNSVFGLRSSYKALPKSQILHWKKVWSLFGDLPSIWSTTAFWIPENGYIWEACSANWRDTLKTAMFCSQHWSTKRAQLCKMTMLCCMPPPTNSSKLNELGYEVLPRPPYSTSSLVTAHHFLKHLDNFFPETASQPARGKECFPRLACWTLKHNLHATEIYLFIVNKNVLITVVPIGSMKTCLCLVIMI